MTEVEILCELLNCLPEDIETIKKGVYRWKSVTYELVHNEDKTAPSSHYTRFVIDDTTWAIRELGQKSSIIKNQKKL